MSCATSLAYSEYSSLTQENKVKTTDADASWEKTRSMHLKLTECDETPLKSEYLNMATYYYSKNNNLIVKIDNHIRERVSMTEEEAMNISKWNNIIGARF